MAQVGIGALNAQGLLSHRKAQSLRPLPIPVTYIDVSIGKQILKPKSRRYGVTRLMPIVSVLATVFSLLSDKARHCALQDIQQIDRTQNAMLWMVLLVQQDVSSFLLPNTLM